MKYTLQTERSRALRQGRVGGRRKEKRRKKRKDKRKRRKSKRNRKRREKKIKIKEKEEENQEKRRQRKTEPTSNNSSRQTTLTYSRLAFNHVCRQTQELQLFFIWGNILYI